MLVNRRNPGASIFKRMQRMARSGASLVVLGTTPGTAPWIGSAILPRIRSRGGQASGVVHAHHLMELDQVAGGVGQEGLAARSHRSGVARVDAAVAQLGHRGVEVLDLQGEVLAHPRRRGALDQVDLLATGVEPGPRNAKSGRSRRGTRPSTLV